MPPKKNDKKKDEKVSRTRAHAQQAEEDDMSIPLNDVNFKITFDAKHEGGHYLKVKYSWFTVGPIPTDGSATKIETTEVDAGFLKDWNLIQIEGEEPTDLGGDDAKASALKNKAPPPKAGGKGAPGGSTLEEISDNRPRTIQYVRNLADEGGTMKVNEDVAHFFEKFLMKVSLVMINTETQEEEGEPEEIELDLSSYLYDVQGGREIVFNHDKWHFQPLLYFNVTVSLDNPMLSPFLRKKMNPLLVHLLGCKAIPYKTDPKYKPIYSKVSFVDGRGFTTRRLPQASNCKFKHKHCFLVGHLDHVTLREQMATEIVSVEVHDNEEYYENKEDAAEAIFSAGRAKFSFRDLLLPSCLYIKLRADIFPLKRDSVDNTKNLDLNTTARKNEKTVERASPYLVNATYSMMTAKIARPIQDFDEKAELMAFKRAQKELERSGTEENIISPGQTSPRDDTIDPDDKMKSTVQSFDRSGQGWNVNEAIFERLIITIPYKAPDQVKQIEDTYEKVNLEGLNLPNVRYLSTKEFSEAERKDRTLDFIGGFCLMDSEYRMYIFEGLGGEGRGIDKFYRENMRQRPNDKKYTMLYNPEVRFKNRVYLDFNVAIKKIKLREPLRAIMGAPDVYLRSKVPQDMFTILQQFAEIRKLTRLAFVRNFNLFPETEKLLTLERKYGDSLSFEDLYGKPGKPKKKKFFEETSTQLSDNRTLTQFQGSQSPGELNQSMQTAGDKTLLQINQGMLSTDQGGASTKRDTMGNTMEESKKEVHHRDTTKRKADTDCNNKEFELKLLERLSSPPRNYHKLNHNRIRSLTHGRPPKERLEVPEGVDVFQYGNQKLNIWEFQKEQLRQSIASDTSKFYTYSQEHLSLAFPVVNENDIKVKEKEENERKWKTRHGFDTLNKTLNWNLHPKKPAQSTIDNLKIPFHIQALETKQKMKDFQFQVDQEKPDFQCNVKAKKKFFSDKSYFKTVFISGQDMMKELAEEKQQEVDAFKKKVIVDNTHFFVNTMEKQKVAQLDRFKNMRENDPKKIGLRFSKQRLQSINDRQILATQAVDMPPVSMLKEEEYKLKGFRPPFKVFDRTRSMGNRDFDTAIHPNYRHKSPKSRHVVLTKLLNTERMGPKWGTLKPL